MSPTSLASGRRVRRLLGDLPLLHRSGVVTLVLLALAALWAGGALHWGLVLGFVAAVPLALRFSRSAGRRAGHVFTGLTVLALGATLWAAFATEEGVVNLAVYYVLYLILARLALLRRRVDHEQLMALSFLLLAAATVFDESLSFGFLFGAYVVVGVLTFALQHLREEIEGGGGAGQQARVSGRDLGALALLALLAFAASIAFFVLFPRMGLGFFARKERPGPTQTGFSESVELGSHGRIRADSTVVMRVRFPQGRPRDPGELYWRGLSFDRYDGRRWSRSLTATTPLRRGPDGEFVLRRTEEDAPLPRLAQDIYLEPIGSDLLFALHPALRLELGPRQSSVPFWLFGASLNMDEGGDLRFRQKDSLGLEYRVESLASQVPAARLRALDRPAAVEGLSRTAREAYLQLPEPLDPRIRALAETVTAQATTDYDRVQALAEHLRRSYAYTTDLPDPGDEPPLSAFLFTHRRGHCEYFATALAILTRSLGIPARNVNGFLGGRFNDFDDYLAVRNAEAHSWVEVPFGPYGWQRFDPTPAGEDDEGPPAWLEPFLEFQDWLRFRWFQYVVEYDLQTQMALLRSAAEGLGAPRRRLQPDALFVQGRDLLRALKRNLLPGLLVLVIAALGGAALVRRAPAALDRRDLALALLTEAASWSVVWALWRPSAGPLARSFALALPALALLSALLRRLRERPRGPAGPRGLAALYLRLRAGLEARGLRCGPGPEALLLAVQAAQPPDAAAWDRLLRRLLELRFGGRKPARGELGQLRRAGARLLRAAQRWQAPESEAAE